MSVKLQWAAPSFLRAGRSNTSISLLAPSINSRQASISLPRRSVSQVAKI